MSKQTFNVHLYPVIRVRVDGIEARSMEEAIEEALKTLDNDFINKHLLQPSEGVIACAEECPSASVDIVGDEMYDHSKSFVLRDGWVKI